MSILVADVSQLDPMSPKFHTLIDQYHQLETSTSPRVNISHSDHNLGLREAYPRETKQQVWRRKAEKPLKEQAGFQLSPQHAIIKGSGSEEG